MLHWCCNNIISMYFLLLIEKHVWFINWLCSSISHSGVWAHQGSWILQWCEEIKVFCHSKSIFLQWPRWFLLFEAVNVACSCPLFVSWILLISSMQKYQYKQVLQTVFRTRLYLIKHWGYSSIIHGKMCITKENSGFSNKILLFLHALELLCQSKWMPSVVLFLGPPHPFWNLSF